MTDLTRVVRRKITTVKGQPLVIALAPEGIWLREPRRRVAYLLPYGVAFVRAADLYQAAQKKAKEAAKKARRAAR